MAAELEGFETERAEPSRKIVWFVGLKTGRCSTLYDPSLWQSGLR